MLQTKEYSIKSCDDFELNIKRKSKLNFKLTYDDSKETQALLVFIPGCGSDANTSYKEHLPLSVAKELNVAVLVVDYFGISNRPFLGGKCMLDDFDKEFFKYSCDAVGFRLDDDFDKRAKYVRVKDPELGENEDAKYEYLDDVMDNLNLYIGMLKLHGKVKMDYHMHLLFTLEAKNDEYQNFGLMPCVDIINAILHIKANVPFNLAGGGKASICLAS